MSESYVSKEVSKIMSQNDFKYPLNQAMACAWIMGNFKGLNLKIVDVSETSSLADFFVMGSATNATQANAMADTIVTELREQGATFISKEGLASADWILLDMGDILVHIFQDTARSVYDLDTLYQAAEVVEIPSSYYFSSPESEQAEEEKKYF